ncbi:hypothetical protein [Tateyamaria pelophila]|uniref:hypothetical protein n=1 Tax=Tateyamaria pelophila TaxID=328415 RepID=UPI001CBAB6E5|nr:hypothetical protein [Tateyamaria pelophila]
MISLLLLGVVAGMIHALEADHLAAVATLSSEGGGRRRLVLRGATWGLGHTITLFLICAAVIQFSMVLTPSRAAAFECAVGVMMVVLAGNMIRKMKRNKVHFHAHDHGDGLHVHAHSHATANLPHARDPHDHAHSFPVKALLVGLLHGAAGSAALIALALASAQTPTQALIYVLCFGLGSIVGMAAMSSLAAWPLMAAEKTAGWVHKGSQIAIATIAGGIGIAIILETWPIAMGTT